MEKFYAILERYWTTPEDTNPTMDAPTASSADTSGDAAMDGYEIAEMVPAQDDTLPNGESSDQDLFGDGDSDVIMDIAENTEQEPLKDESPQDSQRQNDTALESVEVVSSSAERPSQPCAESPTVDPPMASVPGSSPVTRPSQEHTRHERISSPKKFINRGKATSSIVTPSDSTPMLSCQDIDPAKRAQLVAARVAELRQGCLTKSLGSCFIL